MITGRVYDIQPFSVHDGPGVRTTIFLKGCPLRCPWCHSPESQAFYKQLSWFSMRCLGTKVCNDKCLKACEKGAIEYGQTRVDGTALDLNPGADPAEYTLQLVHVKRDLCDNCGDCAKVCRAKALELTGTDYTVDELVRMMKKDKQFFDRT
ncbi:MAG: 4Fe-4S cluster-binding domain-containing protein, partial [Lachnospiraceae bacterium]|nr:4Fe-4S cluster-binding domain-containing protein [Lachnospiraceae bacterium]